MNTLKTLLISAALVLSASILFAQKSTENDSRKLLEVYIPNAFTPNMDGINDVFKPIINGPEIEFYELLIVDRAGREVFSSNEPSEVWNGTSLGSNYTTSPSLYIYFLKVKSVESLETQVFKGHVVMVR